MQVNWFVDVDGSTLNELQSRASEAMAAFLGRPVTSEEEWGLTLRINSTTERRDGTGRVLGRLYHASASAVFDTPETP